MIPSLAYVLLALIPAPPFAQELLVKDTLLETQSSGSSFTATIGNELTFEFKGLPGGFAFLGTSSTAPFNEGSVGGVTIEIDMATAFFPMTSMLMDAQGLLAWSNSVPEGLVPGTSLWTQAAIFDPLTGALNLTNGIRLDLVDALAGDLPLLSIGIHPGLTYHAPATAAEPTLDSAWHEIVAAGVDAQVVRLKWCDIEILPGVYDTSGLQAQLAQLSAGGFETFLSLATIDRTQLALPSDLLDPSDPQKLAPGLTWDHPTINVRFQALLDFITPHLASNDGFFLSIGREVDRYLVVRPAEVQPFADFIKSSSLHVHATQPKLGVGASLSFNTVATSSPILTAIRATADNVPFVYYPIENDFTMRDPSVAGAEILAMAQAVAPRPLMLEEYGYPSGYLPIPTNGSSLEKQRQFIENCFQAFVDIPKVRLAACNHLADFSSTEVMAIAGYVGIGTPLFHEFVASLGLREQSSGAPKLAYAEFLLGLAKL